MVESWDWIARPGEAASSVYPFQQLWTNSPLMKHGEMAIPMNILPMGKDSPRFRPASLNNLQEIFRTTSVE
jgi:hypothetical protein